MAELVKFNITEKDGVELEYPEELSFIPLNMPFDPIGLSNLDPSDTDLDKVLKRLGAATLETSSSYKNQFLNTPSTTTAVAPNWDVKLEAVTNTVLPRGYYIAHFTGDISNDKANKPSGFNVRWREDGVNSFQDIHESLNGTATSNAFQTRSGFAEIPVEGGNTVTLQFRFGYTETGSELTLKNVGFYLFKVRDYPVP